MASDRAQPRSARESGLPEPPVRKSVLSGLYTGTGAFDIVGRRKAFYLVFGLLVLVCLGSMVFRGFNLSIDFVGGTNVQFPTAGATGDVSTDHVARVAGDTLGSKPESVQLAGSGKAQTVQIRTAVLTGAQQQQLKQALFDTFAPRGPTGQPDANTISETAVSGNWGGEITRQALIALVHDLVVTAGVYSLVGFEVSPSTVIGLLTILGYSLYDTVVVFDKVKENSRGLLGLTRRDYAETANLALNQTLMRSINTSLFALLPVAGLLVVGVGVLGVGTLADLALVQLVGMIAGALSSILLATPILVDLKMRDPRFRQQASRVATRKAKGSAAAQARESEVDVSDDSTLDSELRRERALAAAAGVPARNRVERRDSGSRSTRGARPATRPTGKRHR